MRHQLRRGTAQIERDSAAEVGEIENVEIHVGRFDDGVRTVQELAGRIHVKVVVKTATQYVVPATTFERVAAVAAVQCVGAATTREYVTARSARGDARKGRVVDKTVAVVVAEKGNALDLGQGKELVLKRRIRVGRAIRSGHPMQMQGMNLAALDRHGHPVAVLIALDVEGAEGIQRYADRGRRTAGHQGSGFEGLNVELRLAGHGNSRLGKSGIALPVPLRRRPEM